MPFARRPCTVVGAVLSLGLLVRCGDSPTDLVNDAGVTARADGSTALDSSLVSSDGAILPGTCLTPATGSLEIIATPSAGEFALTLDATSSATSWGEIDNQAVVLEVSSGVRFIGHLILHQGATAFTYSMHLGALAQGDKISLKVSSLSASKRPINVCVTGRALLSSADIPELLDHAPIYLRPTNKRFDDTPLLVGWSKAGKSYQTVYTNENGGTAKICGGGAKGMQAEIARWGRSTDVESLFTYGATPTWARCKGVAPFAVNSPRVEGAHPIFYHGDGHNRVFENRTGYGTSAGCGTGAPEKPDGDIPGWGGTDVGATNDAQYSVTLRPLPVALDPLGYATASGRREAIADVYAPWIYRIGSLELERESKIDGTLTLPMNRYAYVDLHLADVDGKGDAYCALTGVSGGFKLSMRTKLDIMFSGPQMTADFTGAGDVWKRLAIPLPAGVTASDIKDFLFDAYDNDGIYLYEIGDVFIPIADGPNGAKLEYVRQGKKAVNVYVDDGKTGCVNNVTTAPNGSSMPCAGGTFTFPK